MPHPYHGVAPFAPKLGEVATADLAPFDPFEWWPEALIRIQLRGIGRPAFQVETWGRAMGPEVLDGVATVHRCRIPDAPHPTRRLAP